MHEVLPSPSLFKEREDAEGMAEVARQIGKIHQ
jgi:hypothetical protein